MIDDYRVKALWPKRCLIACNNDTMVFQVGYQQRADGFVKILPPDGMHFAPEVIRQIVRVLKLALIEERFENGTEFRTDYATNR